MQSGEEEEDIGDGHEWEAAGGYEDADAELLIDLDEAEQGMHSDNQGMAWARACI